MDKIHISHWTTYTPSPRHVARAGLVCVEIDVRRELHWNGQTRALNWAAEGSDSEGALAGFLSDLWRVARSGCAESAGVAEAGSDAVDGQQQRTL